MELEELEVCYLGAGTEGEAHAIAGGDFRVRRVREELPRATRGQRDDRSVQGLPLASPRIHQFDARDPPICEVELRRDRVLSDLDGVVADTVGERGLDLGAGAVAAGMKDAGVGVSGLVAEGDLAVVQVELDPVENEILDALRGLVTENTGCGLVNETSARIERVLEVCGGVVFRSDRGGDATLGPASIAVLDASLRHDEDGADSPRLQGDEKSCDSAPDNDRVIVRAAKGCHGELVYVEHEVPASARSALAVHLRERRRRSHIHVRSPSLAILPIRRAGDPVLREKARRVRTVDSSIMKLIEDMWETMYDAPGVGLAAPQVGISLKVIVIDADGKKIALINPEIVKRSGKRQLDEGCLSVPGYRGEITRSVKVLAQGIDPYTGKEVRIKANDDLLAEALEHEIDHVNGILYIDYLSGPDQLIPLRDAPEVRR